MTAAIPVPPLLGMYETGSAFPAPGPGAWASGPTTNLTANYFAFYSGFQSDVASFITQCDSNGLTAYVELEPWYQSGSTVVAILFSAITSGSYDSELEAVGTAIAAATRPVIVTWAHEFNVSGQYPWATGANATLGSGKGSGTSGADVTPSQWITAWEYVRAKVNSTAGGNALWMWACSAWTGGTTIDPTSYWPGASQVDMVGIDGYPAVVPAYDDPALGTFTGQIGQTVSAIRAFGWSDWIFISETNLANMVASGGESITDFVADMFNAHCSGILEFEDATWDLPQMSPAQWAEYNTAIAANFGGGTSGGGGGGGGSGGGAYAYTQTLIDGFSGSSLDSGTWTVAVGGDGVSVSSGAVHVAGSSLAEQTIVYNEFAHDLADGIFGIQVSQSGTGVTGTILFVGLADNFVSAGGNALEWQGFPFGGSGGSAGSWYAWAFPGEAVSGDTGSQDLTSPSAWADGDWLGIGNFDLNGTGDVHVYKSSDGVNWTEIAEFTATGALNFAACGFYFGVEYDDGVSGTSTYVASFANFSWFTRGAAPSGGGGLYTLFGGAAPSGGTVASNTGTLGVVVEAGEGGTLPEILFYSPATATVLPSEIALYAVTGEALVTSQSATWSGAAGSGWVSASFSSAPSLTPGAQYVACVFGTSFSYYWVDGYWAASKLGAAVTSGPLSAPAGAGAQGWYSSGSSLAYPSSQFDNSNYWVDAEFAAAAMAASSGMAFVAII